MQEFIKQNTVYLRTFLEQIPLREPYGHKDCKKRPEPLKGEIRILSSDLRLLEAYYPTLRISTITTQGKFIDALKFLGLVHWDNDTGYLLVENAASKLDKAIMSMIPTNLSDAVAWLKQFKDMVDLGIMDLSEYEEKKEQVNHLF